MRSLLSILFIGLTICGSGYAEKAISIGHHRQMFIDDFLIDETSNITRRLYPVEKYPKNPVVRPDRPWERLLAVPQGSVIYDEQEKIFKMWYTTNVQSRGEGKTFNKGKALAYATSEDGVHWDKPEMDIVIEDSRKTNQVIAPMEFGYMYQPYFVIKDLEEENPQQRYKMAFLSIQRNVNDPNVANHDNTRRGSGVAFSADGLHWNKAKDFASDELIDISHFMVDPTREDKYVIYGRTLKVLPEIQESWKGYEWFKSVYGGRAVIRSTSRDFLNWKPTDFILGPDLKDPPSTEIYSMNVFPYEGIYLGLVQRYLCRLDKSTIDIQLAISRDGVHFERPFRNAFFPLGSIGTWDRFQLHNMSGPPVTQGDELWFYYGGRTSRHRPNKMADAKPGGAIGLATVLRDRFVAVEASFDGGRLLTKPVKFEGAALKVNANTTFGKIEIRLLDDQGDPLQEYEARIEGVDSIEHLVTFEKGIQTLQGQPVQVEFMIYNAQLYSFSIE